MSVAYQAIIIKCPLREAEEAIESIKRLAPIVPLALADRLTALILDLPRNEWAAFECVSSMGCQLSMRFGEAVAVLYNDMVGFRESHVFRNGLHIDSFGAESERWVPMNDAGLPEMDHAPLPIEQYPDDAECECVLTAIEAGLSGIGVHIKSHDITIAIGAL